MEDKKDVESDFPTETKNCDDQMNEILGEIDDLLSKISGI